MWRPTSPWTMSPFPSPDLTKMRTYPQIQMITRIFALIAVLWGSGSACVFTGCPDSLCESGSFGTQGEILFDEIGNIRGRLTNRRIVDDGKITKNSVFILYIYKKDAFLSQEVALAETGEWGCPHGRLTAPTEEEILDNPTADGQPDIESQAEEVDLEEVTATTKDNCMEGLGFSNEPGYAADEIDRATGRKLHPIEDLNLSVNQWTMDVFTTDASEVPARYLHDYNHFQSLGEPRNDGDRFDAYVAVYYHRKNALDRNPIRPDKISPPIPIQARFIADGPDDIPGNLYSIPNYETWFTSLADADRYRLKNQ